MAKELANAIAQRFIARTDAKAIQTSRGYMPDRNLKNELVPWNGQALLDHLSGKCTYGHYLLNKSSQVKLFCFDIDLNKMGWCPPKPMLDYYEDDRGKGDIDWVASHPREDWREHKRLGRDYYKLEMRTIAEHLSMLISRELEIPTVMAYSGNKGLHVYGFTGLVPASDARAGAQHVLDLAGITLRDRAGNFTPDSYYRVSAPSNVTIEVYPKQDEVGADSFGNLLRLPLGKNIKSPDPTFFVDQRQAHDQLIPHPDPVSLLNSGNPWAD